MVVWWPLLVFWSILIHPLKCFKKRRASQSPKKWVGRRFCWVLTGALASSEVLFAISIFMVGQPTPPVMCLIKENQYIMVNKLLIFLGVVHEGGGRLTSHNYLRVCIFFQRILWDFCSNAWAFSNAWLSHCFGISPGNTGTVNDPNCRRPKMLSQTTGVCTLIMKQNSLNSRWSWFCFVCVFAMAHPFELPFGTWYTWYILVYT